MGGLRSSGTDTSEVRISLPFLTSSGNIEKIKLEVCDNFLELVVNILNLLSSL